MLNKLLKEVIKLPRTAIQTTTEEVEKILFGEKDEDEE